jgi:hypothetical protein
MVFPFRTTQHPNKTTMRIGFDVPPPCRRRSSSLACTSCLLMMIMMMFLVGLTSSFSVNVRFSSEVNAVLRSTSRSATIYAPSWETTGDSDDDDNNNTNNNNNNEGRHHASSSSHSSSYQYEFDARTSTSSSMGQDDSTSYYNPSSSPPPPAPPPPSPWNHGQELKCIIQQKYNSVATLARLAAAFATTENHHSHFIPLQEIQQVQVLDVFPDHIDIEALICEQDRCVSLAVPVPFPHPCMSSDENDTTSECVLENLESLDVVARQTLEQLEWEAANAYSPQGFWVADATATATATAAAAAAATATIHYPSWWETPTRWEDNNNNNNNNNNNELTQECSLLCEILNEDSQDLIPLVPPRLGYVVDPTVVVVVAIGPAGMILAANYIPLSFSSSSSSSSSSPDATTTTTTTTTPATTTTATATTAIMDTICIPFHSVARTAESLRTAVLAILEGPSEQGGLLP